MNQIRIKKMVLSAMFCALVFTATWIAIPAPLVGNVNLGDGILLVGVWMLGNPWAVIACAMGATLCDLVSGYAIYAPATFCIKVLMGAVVNIPFNAVQGCVAVIVSFVVYKTMEHIDFVDKI